jgi:hemolysin D
LLPLFREQYQALEALYRKKLTSRDSLLESGKNIPSPAIGWWPQKPAHRRYGQPPSDREEAQARTADKTNAL